MSNDRLVKVAFATKDKTRINAGFEQAHCIVVYEIGVADARQCTTMTYHAAPSNAVGSPESHLRNSKGNPGCGGGRKKEDTIDENEILAKAASLAGISVLFVDKALHAFSAFILNEARIFTVKVDDQREIADTIMHLQEMLRGEPPLWLRRALINEHTSVDT